MSNIPVIGQNNQFPTPQNNNVGAVPVVPTVPMVGMPPMPPMAPMAPMSPMPPMAPMTPMAPMAPMTQVPVAGMPVQNTGPDYSLFGNSPTPFNSGVSPNDITSPQQAVQLRIRKVVLIETKPQSEQRSRIFIPRVDGHTINVLNNYKNSVPAFGVDSSGEMTRQLPFNSNIIADLHSQGAKFFSLSPQPGGVASIVNGWSNTRFKFMITVDVFIAGKHIKTEYINGHTDYVGANWSTESLDPNMVFYIDSVSTSIPYINSSTNSIGQMVKDASVVLSKSNVVGFDKPETMVATRPQDVFSELAVGIARKGAEEIHGTSVSPAGNIPYFNMNTVVSSKVPLLSNVFNNDPVNYAARVLDAHSKTFSSAAEATDVFRTARSLVKENTFSSSHFTHMLDEQLGSINGVVGNSFTLNCLYKIDNNLQNPMDQRIVVARPEVYMRELQRTATGDVVSIPAGNSADSFSGTGEDIADAMSILHSACAHFRKAGAAYVSCVLTNHGGFPESVISSLYGIDDGTLGARVKMACDNIMAEAVKAITRDQMSYYIQIHMDTYNDAFIKIQIGMNSPREFVAPCFALGVTSPVVTNDQGSFDRIVDGVRSISENIYGININIGDVNPFNSGTTLW